MISMPFIFSNVLGGPVWAAVATVYVIVIAVAIFVCLDAFRPRRRERFAEILEPRVLYVGLSLLFLMCVAGVWLPQVPRDWSLLPVLFTPFGLATGTAYLLRVVYPAPPVGDYMTGDEDRPDSAVSSDVEAAPTDAETSQVSASEADPSAPVAENRDDALTS